MLSNHIKVSFRTLGRNRTFSVVNILGLALGIAIFLLIAQYIAFEWGANRFHKNYKEIYRASVFTQAGGKGDYFLQPGLATVLKNRVPGVSEVTKIAEGIGSGIVVIPGANGSTAGNKSFQEDKVSLVDGNFLKVFTFPLTEGSNLLAQAQTMAISASTAKKYFSSNNAIGKVVNLKNQFGNTPYTITAVYADMPQQSDVKADVLISFKTLETASFRNGNDWADPTGLNSGYSNIYFLLNKQTDAGRVETQATSVIRAVLPDNDKSKPNFKLQPLNNLHLAPSFNYQFQTFGSLVSIVSFLTVALLIMVIAWLNYINLSTAQALHRAKESGVRKVLGASRMQIVGQYLTETVMLTLISIVIAIGLMSAAQPFYNSFLEKPLSLSLLNQGWFWVAVGVVVFSGCLLAGGYIAFILSSFNPLKTIRGKASLKIGGISLRRGLVVFQFTISIVLIISTITLYRQLKYMQTQDLGMDITQRMVITGPSVVDSDHKTGSMAFKQALSQLPYVQKVSASNNIPGQGYNFTAQGITKMAPANGDDKKSYAMLIVDEHYFDTYDIKLKQGTNFNTDMAAQGWSKARKVILNEKAAQQLGFKNAEDVVGQKIKWGPDYEVVGVVKDYHHLSLHEEIKPMIFLPSVADGYFTIKIDTRNLQAHINELKAMYGRTFPGEPFTYVFDDEVFDRQYRTEQKLGTMFMVSAGAAIFIAALGLFGLAAFAARQKVKEIGIRKVLGASLFNIVSLISADFVKLVLVSILIASPIAWYIMNKWLQDFAYRIGIQWWVFLVGGGIAVLIALITVSLQSLKAASANPVKSLRNE